MKTTTEHTNASTSGLAGLLRTPVANFDIATKAGFRNAAAVAIVGTAIVEAMAFAYLGARSYEPRLLDTQKLERASVECMETASFHQEGYNFSLAQNSYIVRGQVPARFPSRELHERAYILESDAILRTPRASSDPDAPVYVDTHPNGRIVVRVANPAQIDACN